MVEREEEREYVGESLSDAKELGLPNTVIS